MEETKTTSRRVRKPALSPEVKADFSRMVETAAYFRAERRGFAPGFEVQDWLEAEAEIEALLTAKEPRRAATRRPAPVKAPVKVKAPQDAARETTAPKKRAAPRARKPKGH